MNYSSFFFYSYQTFLPFFHWFLKHQPLWHVEHLGINLRWKRKAIVWNDKLSLHHTVKSVSFNFWKNPNYMSYVRLTSNMFNMIMSVLKSSTETATAPCPHFAGETDVKYSFLNTDWTGGFNNVFLLAITTLIAAVQLTVYFLTALVLILFHYLIQLFLSSSLHFLILFFLINPSSCQHFLGFLSLFVSFFLFCLFPSLLTTSVTKHTIFHSLWFNAFIVCVLKLFL